MPIPNEDIAFLRQLAGAQDQPRNIADRLRRIASDLEWHESQVRPFCHWAQEYLDGGRWAGFTYYDAIQTELLERDVELAALRAHQPPAGREPLPGTLVPNPS